MALARRRLLRFTDSSGCGSLDRFPIRRTATPPSHGMRPTTLARALVLNGVTMILREHPELAA